MNQSIDKKIENKISEDLSPARNLTGLHLKIVAAIAIIWSFFQLWYASPFPFMFDLPFVSVDFECLVSFDIDWFFKIEIPA